jgi:hypothetical protein
MPSVSVAVKVLWPGSCRGSLRTGMSNATRILKMKTAQFPVPEGHPTIAQHFSVGLEPPKAISSPEGTVESALPTKVSRPFGTYWLSFVDTQS